MKKIRILEIFPIAQKFTIHIKTSARDLQISVHLARGNLQISVIVIGAHNKLSDREPVIDRCHGDGGISASRLGTSIS